MSDCKCDKCQEACKYTPGWFLPNEAEKAAQYLGISLQQFFSRFLGINWWEENSELDTTFVLAPSIIDMEPGTEYPGDPRGQCIFFKDGLCEIHAVKPFECAQGMHDEPTNGRHFDVAKAWVSHQPQIKNLLGREPETQEFHGSFWDMF
jgi:Fe-S-cluster containining protein